MVRRICPICDQVMSGSHYCRNCRSWVKHPYVRDVRYYLNERHPEFEPDCSYHAGLAPYAGPSPYTGPASHTGPDSVPRAGKHSGSWTPGGDRQTGSSMGHVVRERSTAPVRQERPKAPKSAGAKKNTGVLAVVVVLVAMKLLGSCASMGIKALNTVMIPPSPEQEYDVDLGDFYGEAETWDVDYIELEEAEVIAAGVECSRENHFAASGAEFEESFLAILNRHSLPVTGSNAYSYNEQYDDGDTWYVTWTVYDLNDGENGAYQYAELDYDTATKALHQIDVTLADPQVLAEVSGDVLDALEKEGALLPGENCAPLLREEMSDALTWDGGYVLQRGALTVDGYFEGDHYVVSIYRIKE